MADVTDFSMMSDFFEAIDDTISSTPTIKGARHNILSFLVDNRVTSTGDA